MNEKRLQHLKVVYGIALTVIALMIFSSSFTMRYAIQSNSGDSRVINLSGRQRMLSQRLTKCVLALEHEAVGQADSPRMREIADSFAAWKTAHLGLQHGNEKLGLPARQNSAAVSQMFAAIEPFHAAMVQALEELLSQVKDRRLGPDTLRSTAEVMLRNESSFLGLMDKITFQFDKEARERIASLQSLDMVILGVGLLVLLLEFMLVFRPSLSQLALLMASTRRAEALQHEALNRLQKIAARVPGVVYQFRLHPDGRACFPYASEGLREIYRVSPEDVQLDAVRAFACHHPDDQDGVLASLQQSAQDLTPWDHEFRVCYADGTVRWLLGNALPQREADGTTIWHGFISDITERRRAQAELQAMALRAERASAAKSEFLANMSHEIRTPMNGVLGMVGLLLDTNLNEHQRHCAQTVRASGEALLALLNDILDFSKIEAGKLELEMLPFSLHSLLDDFIWMMALRAHEKGLVLGCVVEPDVVAELQGDPGRLQQILINLTGNSVKFTAHGEIVIRVSLVEETATQVRLRFSVRDTGIGIPDDKLERLFAKFSQVDASTTRHYGGTGLGLAISKQLVEIMGGEIGVHSEFGKGSEFWFTVALAKQPDGSRAVAPPLADLSGVHVLIVDDHQVNREIFSILLQSWGLRPAEVADGPAALEALTQAQAALDPFVIAILDMQMPGMDGITLGRAIKSDVQLKDTHLVLCSSLGQSISEPQRQEIGFRATLNKPVRRPELRQALAAASSGRPSAATPNLSMAGLVLPVNLRHARILVAEDNITNQQVAVGILKKFGLRAEVAANGSEALQALKTIPFDLVLMDVQMPELDGLEATRQIRDPQSRVLHPRVPIIAMTAHAMQSDREKCLQAGMDDYITKPIEVPALLAALQKWLSPGQSLPAHSKEAENKVAPTPLAEELAVFNRESFVERLLGDEELGSLITDAFLGDLPGQLLLLQQFVAAQEAHQVEQQAHKIKSAAANIGGEVFCALLWSLEQAGKAGDQATMVACAAELQPQFEALKAALKGPSGLRRTFTSTT